MIVLELRVAHHRAERHRAESLSGVYSLATPFNSNMMFGCFDFASLHPKKPGNTFLPYTSTSMLTSTKSHFNHQQILRRYANTSEISDVVHLT